MTATSSWPARRAGRSGFAARLLAAQALVLVAGALTSWLVATAVAPGIFHEHLRRAGVAHTSGEARHVEDAFGAALLLALVVALVASVLLALAVTWYFTRRVQRSIGAVAQSAAQIADGRYHTRVESPGLGAEFDQLASTFNQLALRLEAVENTRRRMLADLAHEMRTPLATIDAHLEAIEDGMRRLDEETLAVLRGSTQRLGRLAQDMAAVSRAEEGGLEMHLALTEPRRLLAAAEGAARGTYDDHGVRLVTEVSTRAHVRVDPERMAQVLGNLLDNAVRHTPRGGTVTLSASSPDDTWVEFRVTDTGEGIDPDDVAHVFDRFYRADPARHRPGAGSGIGLTITRALVEAQGGGAWAESPGRGRGATFTVRLPAVAGRPAG